MMKLTVSAAHKVTRNSPARRLRYLIAAPPALCPAAWE
jgi:hypothetical protein